MVVATQKNLFRELKKSLEEGKISSLMMKYAKIIPDITKSDDKKQYFNFLSSVLDYCKENKLLEEEALTLRMFGRTYSVFEDYVKSLKFHEKSLKIQRRLGRKLELAEGLVSLGEDLQVSGYYEKCIEAFTGAEQMYQDLGKLRKAKELKKELSRLKEFSRQMVEDEYFLNKFHLDEF